MAYIEREDLITKLNDLALGLIKDNCIQCDIAAGTVVEIKDNIVAKQPTADVVEVVRCKDCKYREEMPNKNIWCAKHIVFMAMKPDDYCSKGERKDGE